MKIKEIIDKYDEIDIYDNKTTVDFINRYYDLLVNYKTEDISEIEDVSLLLRDLFSTLSIMGRFTELIEKRKDVKNFIGQLRGKSKLFYDYYLEVEYLYSEALTINRTEYKEAISVLEGLHNIDPQNENFIDNLKHARLYLRRKIYVKISMLGVLVVVAGLVMGYVDEGGLYNSLSDFGIGMIIIIYFIQLLDWKLTQKTQPLTQAKKQ